MNTKYLIAGGFIFLALAITGTNDFDQVKEQNEEYCENVQLFSDSNGKSGWPDYNETFDEYCKDNQPASKEEIPKWNPSEFQPSLSQP